VIRWKEEKTGLAPKTYQRQAFTFAELCRIGDKKYKKLAELKYRLKKDPYTSITCEEDLRKIIDTFNPPPGDKHLVIQCSIVGGEEKLESIKGELDRLKRPSKKGRN
jgi:hypothetical protein